MPKNNLHLNIVSFDIPYPPSYGGVIDVFYKILALSNQGVKIHLHAFHYGRKHATELEKICSEVCYYPRKAFLNPFIHHIPYIVRSRKSNLLLKNLLKNNYPVLFEGIHCSYYLDWPELKDRLKIVRMHNIEHVYYMHLAKVEENPLKRLYFSIESERLRKYLYRLNNASYVAAISPADHTILNVKLKNSFYLPVFHPNSDITTLEGQGNYVLYHGNLGVGENNEAAIFLVEKVFHNLKIPFIIAGSNPSNRLKKLVKTSNNIKLVNPDTEEIYQLITNAQINILPTFQDTGIKLKLLNALFRGRYCIVNAKMIKDTGLENLCIIADEAKEMQLKVEEFFTKKFDNQMLIHRKNELSEKFNNERSAKLLIEKISHLS